MDDIPLDDNKTKICINCKKWKIIFSFISLKKYNNNKRYVEKICYKCQKKLWIQCKRSNHWDEPSQFVHLACPLKRTSRCLDCRLVTNLKIENFKDKLKEGNYRYCATHYKDLPECLFVGDNNICEICNNKTKLNNVVKFENCNSKNEVKKFKDFNYKTVYNKRKSNKRKREWYDFLNFEELDNYVPIN